MTSLTVCEFVNIAHRQTVVRGRLREGVGAGGGVDGRREGASAILPTIKITKQ